MKLLRSTDIGYSPISARERKIKDGSKFDHLFPAPDLRTTLLQRDGEVEDTVKQMQQIVVDYSWQVRELCKQLKAKTRRQSVKNVFDFVYDYIKYQIEDGEKLRTPAYSWYEGQVQKRQHPNNDKIGVDCDCMSIFCGCCFREMQIPFSFRVTGYENSLGFCRGFQHVYTVAYDTDGKEIICDPVYIEFNKEKEYAIQKTYPMSLNGTDIVMLSGLDDESHHEYIEHPDGTMGELAGKRRAKRKARRKARKEARKEKRAAKKAIKKAKKSGDKEALAKAKEAKKAAKKKLKANRGGIARAAQKVGKGIAKATKAVARFTVATTMQVPRKMFCLLLRLNFRGLATKLANNEKAREKFKKTWRKLGGSTKSWSKAVEKGKNKKPLFGSKKLKGFTELQLNQLGAVLDEWGILKGYTLGDIGELGFATTSVAAAIASATPIIKKVIDIMKNVGEYIPETADEYNGEADTYDDNQEIIDTEPEETEDADESEEEEETEEEDADEEEDNDDAIEVEAEEVEGIYVGGINIGSILNGNEVIAYEVVDVDGLGSLGAGLFKKLASGIKKVVAKRKAKKADKKAKKAAKKATKKAAKADKKAARRPKRTQKKADKTAKKQAKKETKQAKKAQKTATTPAPAPAPSPDPINPDEIELNFGQKIKNGVQQFTQTDEGQALINTAKDIAISKGTELMQKAANNATTNTVTSDNVTTNNDDKNDKKSFFAKHKAVTIVGGVLLVVATGAGIYFATRKKPDTAPASNGGGTAKLNALQLY